MSDIPGRMLRAVLEKLEQERVDAHGIARGLGITVDGGPLARVSAEAYAELLGQVRATCESWRHFEALFAGMPMRLPLIPQFATLARSPREFYLLATQVLGPYLMPFLTQEVAPRQDGSIDILLALPPGCRRPGKALFHSFVNVLGHQGDTSGVPPARLEARIGQREAHFVLRPLASANAAPPPRDAVTEGLLEELVLRTRELAARPAPPDPVMRGSERRLELATTRWRLSPRQRATLEGMARGLSNKEIAQQWGRSEATVELHATALFRKAGVTGRATLLARLYADTEDSGGLASTAAAPSLAARAPTPCRAVPDMDSPPRVSAGPTRSRRR